MLRNAASTARKAVTELSQFPKPGEQLHGFTLVRSKHVPELKLTALHLQHDKTGADYLHIARDDTNNVFSIGFKTNPPNDTGIPHILEHTTLCGSNKCDLLLQNRMGNWTQTTANRMIPDTPSATRSSRCCPEPSPTS